MVALYKGATPIIRRYKGTQLIYDSTVSDNDGETLSFAWSGTATTMTYYLNGTTYTATTNPYSTTLTELGIDEFTNANTMFNGKTYITAITSIPDTSNVTNMNDMFSTCRSLTLLDVSNFNTSNVNNMGSMFYDCRGLTSLDVSNFNTSNVNNMSSMFYKCSGLTSLDVSNFNTSNVNNMSSMFYFCSKLTSLDLSNFNTSNVNNMKDMFNGCSSLTSLELSNFNVSKVTNMNNMFRGCSNLAYLNISGWDLRNVSVKGGMFSNDLNLTTIIMNGCDCDTILFVRQQIQNIGINHIGVIQTDTVCPTYETKQETLYDIIPSAYICEYNETVYPSSVSEVIRTTDEYGVTSSTSTYISDFTVSFEPDGENYDSNIRIITATVYYNGQIIGTYTYEQNPQNISYATEINACEQSITRYLYVDAEYSRVSSYFSGKHGACFSIHPCDMNYQYYLGRSGNGDVIYDEMGNEFLHSDEMVTINDIQYYKFNIEGLGNYLYITQDTYDTINDRSLYGLLLCE